MSETSSQTPEGIDRTQTGEIKDQSSGATQQAEPGTQSETKTAETKTGTTETTGTETKAKDGKSLLNQEDGEKKDSAPAGAPEKYEPFKAPEGFVITPEATEQLAGLFREAGVSQASAQKLIDYIAPQLMEATEAPFKAYQEMREGWQKETMDQFGSKLPEVKTTVSRALDSLNNPKLVTAFKEAMDMTGAGDNPAFINVIYEWAKKVSEGTHVRGAGPSKFGQAATSRPASAAAAVYPHLPSAG